MPTSLNLRRNTRTYVLVGVLLILVAGLMLTNPDRSWGDIVFGLIFMIGGLTSISYLNRLTLDETTHELVHQTGVFVPLRSKRYPLKKISAIRIKQKTERSHNKERTTFPVQLSGIKDATVLKHRNPWFSRVIAEQLARLLKVPMVNRVYGETSTREPDDLDTPLIERWRRDNVQFEKPTLRYDSKLQESAQGSTYRLWIPAEMPQLKYLVVVLFLLVLPAVLNVPFSEVFHSRAYRILAVIFLAGGIMALALIGRSRLTVSSKELTFRQGYFPLKTRLPVTEIEELIVANDGITLIGDTKAIWVHWGSSKQDSDYLEAIVPYQIQRFSSYAIEDA